LIETVLGPIRADQLGITSMHEHLLCDARVLRAPAREPPPEVDRVTIENLGFVRWNLLALEDNLVLDDPLVAAAELRHACELGQRTVVDLTSSGLGARPHLLPQISRDSGLHVVAGYGVYLDRPHPQWVLSLDEDAVTERFVRALEDELDDCGFRAGLLGIIGTSEPITRSEQRVLRASARAAARTGAAITVRLDPAARRGREILTLLESHGCPPEQVVLGNVDEFLDLGYLRELSAGGATLEWCFGNEAYYRDGYKDPTDAERLSALISLLSEDDAACQRIVFGCSVWTKSQLRRYGGMGYDHLLRRIVPELARAGVSESALDAMLVSNPARLLDR
jgi:phosphotriesterase-related protein